MSRERGAKWWCFAVEAASTRATLSCREGKLFGEWRGQDSSGRRGGHGTASDMDGCVLLPKNDAANMQESDGFGRAER